MSSRNYSMWGKHFVVFRIHRSLPRPVMLCPLMAVGGIDMIGLNCKPKASGFRLSKCETADPLEELPSPV